MDFNELDSIQYNIVDDGKIEYLLSLLKTSGLSNEVKEELIIELETFDITPERYDELNKIIFNSQLDAINSGFNYTQTDINKKLKKEI
jgi:hypothetical protein